MHFYIDAVRFALILNKNDHRPFLIRFGSENGQNTAPVCFKVTFATKKKRYDTDKCVPPTVSNKYNFFIMLMFILM